VAILIAGLVGAIWIYLAAVPADNALGYDPMQSKKYLHDLELYGGTANVLAAQFSDWFAGLWHGRNLAYTIAVLTVLTALAVRAIARILPRLREDAPETES